MPPKQKDDLRVLFWNIRDWRNDNAPRFERIMSVLRKEKPDVALFAEVCDPALKTALVKSLKPAHVAFETADKNHRQLVAVFRAAAGRAVTVEQRNEFSDDCLNHRTFPLVRIEDKKHGSLAILAAHTKSGSNSESMTQRTRQFGQIGGLATAMHGQNSPLLVMGDLNTMGNSGTVDGQREISIMTRILAHADLHVLPKDQTATWHGVDDDARYADADLDHALLSREAAPRAATVRVGGWPEQPTARRKDNWVRTHSDHAYLVVDLKPKP